MYKIYADDVLFYSPNLQDEDFHVIDPRLTLELNKAGSLEFTLPISNVVYNTLQKLKTTIHVYDDKGVEIFREGFFMMKRISTTENMYMLKVLCLS